MQVSKEYREEFIKKAREIVKNSGLKGDKKTQLQNMRSYVRKDIPLDEFILYLEYQAARNSLPKDFVNSLTKYLSENRALFSNRENLKYFIGNLVRAGMVYLKTKEKQK